MRRAIHMLLVPAIALAVSALALSACASSSSSSSSKARACPSPEPAFASFDPYAGAPQRIMVGLICDDGQVIAGGTLQFAFTYRGTKDAPIPPQSGPTAPAAFLAIPGRGTEPPPTRPEPVRPSRTTGVYAAVTTLPQAGVWSVRVTGGAAGGPIDATTSFVANATPQVVAVGDPAPRTQNPLAGDTTVAPSAIDSRAQDGAPIPDPELHSTSIADALGAGRPIMVVVSTPVYCTSQFCGPITDAVNELARQYGDRMAFVHLEVWRDFQNNAVNDTALEWIGPKNGTDANEPWVFVVGRDGRVIERFDNVATTEELHDAVNRALA